MLDSLSFELDFFKTPIEHPPEPDSTQYRSFMTEEDFGTVREQDVVIERVLWEYWNGLGWARLFPSGENEDLFTTSRQGAPGAGGSAAAPASLRPPPPPGRFPNGPIRLFDFGAYLELQSHVLYFREDELFYTKDRLDLTVHPGLVNTSRLDRLKSVKMDSTSPKGEKSLPGSSVTPQDRAVPLRRK